MRALSVLALILFTGAPGCRWSTDYVIDTSTAKDFAWDGKVRFTVETRIGLFPLSCSGSSVEAVRLEGLRGVDLELDSNARTERGFPAGYVVPSGRLPTAMLPTWRVVDPQGRQGPEAFGPAEDPKPKATPPVSERLDRMTVTEAWTAVSDDAGKITTTFETRRDGLKVTVTGDPNGSEPDALEIRDRSGRLLKRFERPFERRPLEAKRGGS
jgi:hypothetical protein